MNTTLHSFSDIFDTLLSDNQSSVKLNQIIIPMIQRDYAQGREDPDVARVRSRFLDSLYDAVVKQPITLDFVYGDIDDEGVMTPLDGQQRLTTLFLLHWYAAKRAGLPEEEYAFLSHFGYKTRYSARQFCQELVRFTPSFQGTIQDEIIDQAWFPLDWKKDPTIRSMLVMLNAIDDRFKDVENLWERLKSGAITFYFLPIKDMGLTDELYIKMNSRGKPLTRFEHFKAEFERCVKAVDEDLSKEVMRKIDRDWTDMLWQYRNSGTGTDYDAVTDDEFLRYFHFVCDIICYQGGESPQGKSSDEFDMLTEYFTGDQKSVRGHIETVKSFFDCWCRIEGYDSPASFQNAFMAKKPEAGKIVIGNANNPDVFEDCLHSYADKSGRIRAFPLNRTVLLYAITCFLRNRGGITDPEFAKRLRCINNLIQNSENQISDRSDRNRIPAILQQTEALMLTGQFDDTIENGFNVNQIAEEKEKARFLTEHPEKTECIHALEDHPNLNGQISIIGLDHVDFADRFASLFACNWDLIDCALMAIGDYGQRERKRHHYQYGSRRMQIAWDELFHKSANSGFEKTSEILIELLSRTDSFSDAFLEQIRSDFIAACEKSSLYPWRYYYVKYNAFRPGSYGILSNRDKERTPYVFSIMQTKTQWSSNTYVPFLKEADDSHLSKASMGQRLDYGDQYVICRNSEFAVYDTSTEKELETWPVRQNEDGVDTEDRVLVLKQKIEELKSSMKG